MMANVLSLVPYKIFPARFGGQKMIALFNNYFSVYHQLTCVTVKANEPTGQPYELLNILSNNKFRYINPMYFFKMRKIIQQKRITHLIIEHPYYGWLGLLLQRFCGIKLIVKSHNIESLRFRSIGKWWWKILWRYEGFIHRHATLSFCITEEDRDYIIEVYHVLRDRTMLVTYGVESDIPPSTEIRSLARETLLEKHSINANETIFLFNGSLGYPPNLEAVRNILFHILPIICKSGLQFKILICGGGLPEEMGAFKEYKNVIYAGFVEDIALYFNGSDVFLNPLTTGGGIKTKLVEALASDLNAVSTTSGAVGVNAGICNHKLLISADQDWEDFTKKMQEAAILMNTIPNSFFDHFYWKLIVKRAADALPPYLF